MSFLAEGRTSVQIVVLRARAMVRGVIFSRLVWVMSSVKFRRAAVKILIRILPLVRRLVSLRVVRAMR